MQTRNGCDVAPAVVLVLELVDLVGPSHSPRAAVNTDVFDLLFLRDKKERSETRRNCNA